MCNDYSDKITIDSDLCVSRLCLGCVPFGDKCDEFPWTLNYDDSLSIIREAIELGVNFFDTAASYSNGTSEENLSKILRSFPSFHRSDFVISTKLKGMLNSSRIMDEVDKSLKRLKTDYIDILYIHRYDDYITDPTEIMNAFNNVVKSGKVRFLGASAMYGFQLHNLQNAAEKNGFSKIKFLQNHYNLLYREDERELLRVAKQFNMHIFPFSPLARGHLSSPTWERCSLRSLTDITINGYYEETKETDKIIIERVAALASFKNKSMTEIALNWLRGRGCDGAVVAATKISQLKEIINGLNSKLNLRESVYLEQPYIPHKIKGMPSPPPTRDLDSLDITSNDEFEKELSINKFIKKHYGRSLEILKTKWLRSGAPVYLYGVGGCAEKYQEFAKINNLDISGFVVSDNMNLNSKSKDGLPVFKLSELKNSNKQCTIVFALDQRFIDEILHNISGVENLNII